MTVRLKLRADSTATFEQARSIAASDTQVFVASHKRLTLSTGELSDQARCDLDALGVRISEDMRYDSEAAF